ncbi:MAG: hypothetical protein J0I20_10075 [Chloroflexi bacterium]|nr:hypothetical protein [Chloroflexota bacterium]OJV94554.1 MAG: hypothetical protein BGO39_22735 [Chloroflexi bacterium 54-19]
MNNLEQPAGISPATTARPGWRNFWSHPATGTWLPLVFYLVVAIIFSWPLALHLGDRVVLSESGDVWQHLWNTWWMRFSLLDLHTHPYTTPMLLHPVGANLFYHALDPMDGYLSIPAQLLFGVVASFNLVILFQLTVAGWGVYLLARYLTGNPSVSLVAGIIYACSPLESRLLNLGQLELTSIEWLPLYILCFLKTLNREARPWLWRVLSVVFLLVLSLDTWYYLLYAVIFSALFTLYKLFQERQEWRQKWPRTLALAIGVMAVYGVLVLPILLPTLREAGSSGATQPRFTVIYNSATLKGLFTTGPSALWGLFGSGDNPEYRGNFLGFIALGLGLLGLIVGFKKNWFWGGVALVFLVLALGLVLHVSFDPNWTPDAAEKGLPLPGSLIFKLPFGNIARVPLRYTLVTTLCLAVLAAYGLAWLLNFIKTRLKDRLKRPALLTWALPALAGLLVFLEFFPGPRTLADTTVPAFYSQIAKEGNWNDFAVLETPDSGSASIISKAMYYQSVSQHPMVGGYLSREPVYPFATYPGIRDLLQLDFCPTAKQCLYGRDILDRSQLKNAAGVLEFYKIRYVIVHPGLLKSQDSQFNANEVLQTVFGKDTKPVYQDGEVQVWRTPGFIESGNPPDPAKVLPQLGDGWGNREDTPNGPVRLVAAAARLELFNPYQQPLQVKLSFSKTQSTKGPTNLAPTLNGQALPARTVSPDLQTVELSLTLQPGLNDLTLKNDSPVYYGTIVISGQ